MRPRFYTRIYKIICVSLGLDHAFIPLRDGVCIALITGIDDGFSFAIKAEFDLALGVWRGRPSHQGIRSGTGARLKLDDPMLYVAAPGLHRVLGWPVYSHMHGITLVFHIDVKNYVPQYGRGGWIRTNDFLLPKQTLYQTELRPDSLAS